MLKRKLWDYKASHPCVDCGESNPVVLTFDHNDDKTDAVSNLVHKLAHNKTAWEKIEAEIKKCKVRCFNCHMKRTAEQLGRYAWLSETERLNALKEAKKHSL